MAKLVITYILEKKYKRLTGYKKYMPISVQILAFGSHKATF